MSSKYSVKLPSAPTFPTGLVMLSFFFAMAIVAIVAIVAMKPKVDIKADHGSNVGYSAPTKVDVDIPNPR